MSFVHLHTHSEFSLLDGANRLRDLVHRAKHYEMPALALTDHGCLFGAWQFQKQARADGLKPIVGMEAYVAPGDRRDRTRDEGGGKNYYHLVLLARDRVGYQNLVKLSSIGYTEGFYYKPRIDREILREYSEGLIVSSACLAGEVARTLMADDWDAAREAASWYAENFRDRYYLEVQGHDSEGQRELNEKIFRLGTELDLPVIATNDAHFLKEDDHEAHDVLLCIGLGKDFDDPNRMRYDEGLYFKSAEEMAERFPDRSDVFENTLKIADEVDLDFETSYHLPAFPLPEGHEDENEYLEHLAWEGARERYGDPLDDEQKDRLEYELGVIRGTGYAGYFLIVQDFIRWARAEGIPVGPGRGSAAGSMVAYALGITNIDPLAFDLLFERFLNPERVSMPDVDIDFCFERRGEVIEYTREKYGKDAVGQIITFGTMKARAVIRDVGRTLGFEPAETDRIAKLIPNAPGQSFTVEEAVRKLKEVRELYRKDERHTRLFDYSMTLEGLSRHASVHAAGVVIAPGPIDDYVPVCVQTGKQSTDDDAMAVTQYDMNSLEEAGMLKMDFLGLKTLTVIHDAVEAVRARVGALRDPETGIEFASIDEVPLDDPAVYRMLARGGTSGVFQFESSLASEKLRAMRCDRFEDLVATNALIRPGPLDSGMTDVYIRRKLGQEEVTWPHPDLKATLEPTYGIIVYQEQVMRIANVLADFSLGEADVLRKAVGKKKADLIAEQLGKFVEAATARGVDAGVARDLAEQIETFGRYGFNKSHSAAYSLISYHTAWLKAHYPAEFMAGLLSSVLDKTDDVVKYIAECRELQRHIPGLEEGIEVLPPDVNESGWKFTAIDGTQVRFGLGAVRGVGAGAVRSILAARESGPFTSLFDFLTRIDLRALNKRACEALVCAGALDVFGSRAQLLAGLDTAYAEVSARQAEEEAGQANLFGGGTPGLERQDPVLPTLPEWDEAERLKREKEAIGFYISGHPLDRFRDVVGAFDTVNTRALHEHAGERVELACVVTAVARQISKRDNSEWGRVTVEDFHGTASVLAFKEAWQGSKEALVEDAVVLLRGQVSDRDRDAEDPPIFLDEVQRLEDLPASGALAVRIELPVGAELDPDVFAKARQVLTTHPGPTPVELTLGEDNGAPAPRFRSRSLTVDPLNGTLAALRELFGAGRVRIVSCGRFHGALGEATDGGRRR
ncbi:MAG: DNA polymerase III subunit alpha [Longimicrobiales bacterium]|nr:DNA polymerase III subunit alpha [Longimicrobiales bacterium]